MKEGAKYDKGKLRWTLMPWDVLEEIVKVYEHGARKYERDNWKKMEDPNRYTDALIRHLAEYLKGNQIDEESGDDKLYHLAQVAWNAIAKLWFDLRRQQ